MEEADCCWVLSRPGGCVHHSKRFSPMHEVIDVLTITSMAQAVLHPIAMYT